MSSSDKLRASYEWLEKKLDNIGNELDVVAKRTENGARLAYPKAFYDAELAALHATLTRKADHLLERMAEIQLALKNGEE